MKKLIKLLVTFLLTLTLLVPSSLSIYAQTLSMEDTHLSLTEKKSLDFEVDFKEEISLDQLSFSLGDKPLSEWKAFNMETEAYDLKPWIRVEDLSIDGNVLKGKLVNSLPYGLDATDLRPYPRWTFEELLGTYPLVVKDEGSGAKASIDIEIQNYTGFHKYEEIQPDLDALIAAGNEKGDRFFKYESIGQTDEGREIPMVIVAKNEETIDHYLNNTLTEALNDPAKLSEKIAQDDPTSYQVPIFINNTHPDESPGIDAQIDLLKDLSTKEEFIFNGQEKDSLERLKVSDVLDNFILIFCVTLNPDGKAENQRENSHKLDINRDNIYQTQAETKAMSATLAKYNPLTFIDLHGFVPEFLIEPTTPPHEPNFEYDLLMGGEMDPDTKDVVDDKPGAIGHARAMGDVGIANSDYTSYIIPMFDYGDGWDDAFLGYTAVFSLIHGALGHTVEIPAQNQQSLLAAKHAVLGSIKYVLDNKTVLYQNQLEIFRRGIENEDNKAVDSWLVKADGSVGGRPRGENDNFFPDYYILPMDKSLQKNVNEVYDMISYFLRNGVKVYQSDIEVTYKDITYPAGSIVIPMNQAKRSLANVSLYQGTDESDWGAMYAEIVLNYPKLHGFDSVEVRQADLFADKLTEITEPLSKPATDQNIESDQVVIKANNNDALILVNKMLADGKEIQIVNESSDEIAMGDYLANTEDMKGYLEGLLVNLVESPDSIKATKVEPPKIYLTPSSSNYAELADETRFVLNQLGFTIVEDIKDANVVVDSSGVFEKDALKDKNYIGIGSMALQAVKDQALYPLEIQMNEDGGGNEGLLKANYDLTNPISGSYQSDDIAYVSSGSVMNQPRPEAKIFAKVADDDDFYLEGWWPGHDFVQGQVLGFADSMEDQNFVFFSTDVTNKAHTRYLYRLLANAIYSINSENFIEGEGLKVSVPKKDIQVETTEETTEEPR
ncbi:M14 family zinc carboxypeptidase [Facklamia miroungae]|uniref:Zinc carboxypeptidase n=1 Tax=Facklamia miroungae TaxID=120956 RepID=A0A1G7SR08_9LACT|nr:M14 family zinc carboxypeptidase [Facklamia miroungae]NKZ29569.1 hypothetical protein [Facklamia miroungae]SDG25473.1 Zinc carboxypeptidase [Facklamia miroungae]